MNNETVNTYNSLTLLSSSLKDIIDLSPLIIPIMSLFEAFLFNDMRGALYFAGSLINFLIYYGIQMFTKSKIDNPKCNIYNKLNISAMPNLHSQTIGFLSGFIFTTMYIKGNFRILATLFCLVLSIIIGLRMYKIGCHTKIQIGVGLLLGILLGIFWAWVISYSYTPWGSDSDIDYSKFNERECDKQDKNNSEYECKAYKNGRIIETSN